MKKNLFIDTNILLDFVLQRGKFADAATSLFTLIEKKLCRGITSAACYTDIFYLMNKERMTQNSITESLEDLIEIVDIVAVDKNDIEFALRTKNFSDFEDAVQYSVAKKNHADYIITRNKNDYKKSEITVLDAEEFIAIFDKK